MLATTALVVKLISRRTSSDGIERSQLA